MRTKGFLDSHLGHPRGPDDASRTMFTSVVVQDDFFHMVPEATPSAPDPDLTP